VVTDPGGNVRDLRRDERGFSFIELLVVMIIVGVLAAIALPTFLGQDRKAQDAPAKSNARNLVSQVESCYADTSDYQGCDEASELRETGLALGAGDGQVHVASASQSEYRIVARSVSGHVFTIEKTAAGTTFSCSPAGSSGCGGAGTW